MPTNMRAARPLALFLAGSVFTPMLAFGAAGCGNNSGSGGGGATTTATAPIGATAPAPGGGSSPMMGNPTTAAVPQQRPGMSTKEKVVILAGAALLYYLYKKHQAAQQNAAAAGGQTASANGAAQGQPQLYQSSNGGIYYRNAQHQAVWVTAPSQGVPVPQSQVSQYLPNYQQYANQPVPAAPAGAPTQSAMQYDPSLASQ